MRAPSVSFPVNIKRQLVLPPVFIADPESHRSVSWWIVGPKLFGFVVGPIRFAQRHAKHPMYYAVVRGSFCQDFNGSPYNVCPEDSPWKSNGLFHVLPPYKAFLCGPSS